MPAVNLLTLDQDGIQLIRAAVGITLWLVEEVGNIEGQFKVAGSVGDKRKVHRLAGEQIRAFWLDFHREYHWLANFSLGGQQAHPPPSQPYQ